MIELTTLFATLSLFLAWRLHVVGKRAETLDILLRGIVSGKVNVTRTKYGVEMELKDNG
jgi:hypothetical protein